MDKALFESSVRYLVKNKGQVMVKTVGLLKY